MARLEQTAPSWAIVIDSVAMFSSTSVPVERLLLVTARTPKFPLSLLPASIDIVPRGDVKCLLPRSLITLATRAFLGHSIGSDCEQTTPFCDTATLQINDLQSKRRFIIFAFQSLLEWPSALRSCVIPFDLMSTA